MGKVLLTHWHTLFDGTAIGAVAVRTNDHEPDAPYQWKAYIGHTPGKNAEQEAHMLMTRGTRLAPILAHAYFPMLDLGRYQPEGNAQVVALAEEKKKALDFLAGLDARLTHLKSQQAYVGITRMDVRLLRLAVCQQPVDIDGEEAGLFEEWIRQVRVSRAAIRSFDEEWDAWQPGDKIVWSDDKLGRAYTIKRIDQQTGYVYWDHPGAPEQMTRSTNLLRVTIKEAKK